MSPWKAGTPQPPDLPSPQHGRMPGPPACKTKAEVLEGILVAMRNASTITTVPLGTCPHSPSLHVTTDLGAGSEQKGAPELGGHWELRLPCLLQPHPTTLSPSVPQRAAPGALAVGSWRRKCRAGTAGVSGLHNSFPCTNWGKTGGKGNKLGSKSHCPA